MRLFVLPLILLILLAVGLNVVIYRTLRRCCATKLRILWLPKCYAVGSALLMVALIVAVFLLHTARIVPAMWLLFVFSTVFIGNLVGVLVLWLLRFCRAPFAGWGALVAGIVVFVFLWWGALVTRFHTSVEEIELPMADLPNSFDGYKVAQISDIHTGTFGGDTTYISRVVDKINSLNPDLILFTGDIVNGSSRELAPHCRPLSRMRAADGVYAVLGNHDYGDYAVWPSENAKVADRRNLASLERAMGWTLLNDSSVCIRRGNDSIIVIGVENIGEPPFHSYGSLKRAYSPLDDQNFKILMTHNPRHWHDSISPSPTANVALTLSGHTHAMQMRFGEWSPSKYKYPEWAGLYTDSHGRHLYVNIGLGTLGMPARLGNAYPEITIFTLKSTSK